MFCKSMDTKRLPQILRALYEAVDALEEMFPGRHFTLDGHMVGSLGEVLAEHCYAIQLSQASAYCHDGICAGRLVQVKTTQGTRIALSSEPEHLLVLRLNRDGTFEEEYNGPGARVWSLVADKPRPKNGQYQVSLATLRKVMKGVGDDQMLKRRRP